ncbi:hypothetical protein GUJ93_ZPchr0003g16543 [Zizania palustris]|uniref:Uncharacterized protein n=1 Tax=Zizania palustris TaxID=103762 RepID=A0A8J5STZ5_ZIZPA|nr:hypothetical protein GUJ93_ZPchr0003g16543 [Zizania palustris]
MNMNTFNLIRAETNIGVIAPPNLLIGHAPVRVRRMPKEEGYVMVVEAADEMAIKRPEQRTGVRTHCGLGVFLGARGYRWDNTTAVVVLKAMDLAGSDRANRVVVRRQALLLLSAGKLIIYLKVER